MADDPVTKFSNMFRTRTPPAAPASRPSPPPAVVTPRPEVPGEAYEAFDAKDKAYTHGLDIRCTSREGALSFVVAYNYIHSVAYDRRTWTRIFMTVSGLAIEIRGRNLRAIVEAIRTRTCHFIQEFSRDEHVMPQPEDPTAPFIESISVEVIGGREARDRESVE